MKTEEKLLMAIGGADERLIEEALEVRVRRKPAILRWVAVAACVCLLLASPVVAAMVGSLVELWPSDKTVSYHINERITIDSLSEEVAEAFDGQKKTVLRYQMDTLEEAEEFLGVELPENEILSGADPKHFERITDEGEVLRQSCLLYLFGNDEMGLTSFNIDAYFQIDNVYAFVMYRAATEQMPYENGGGIGFEVEQFDREDHMTASGMESVIYTKYSGDSNWGWSCNGIATLDGYVIFIRLNAPTKQEAVDTMKTILDAYG